MTTLDRSLESKSNTSEPRRRGASVTRLLTGYTIGLLWIASVLLTALPARADRPLGESLPVVISAGADHDIKEWDASGKLMATLGSHDDAVNALVLINSDSLISVGADGHCKIWSISIGMARDIDAVKGSALSVAYNPTSNPPALAIGTARGKILLFAMTGKKLLETDAHNDGVRALHFSADGATLFSASADRQMRFWKVMISGAKATLDYRSNINAHDEAINGLVVSPDGRTIATISSDGYLKTWQPNGGALINRVKVCDRGAVAVAFSPDGKTLATGDDDGKVRLWNAGSLAPLATLGTHERAVACLAWSPDGKFVVSGGADKTLRYWSLAQGREAARITAHDGVVKAVVVLP